MKWLLGLIQGQPVYAVGLINSGIVLLTAFGFQLSSDQIAAIMVFANAMLSFVLQRSVTPMSAPMVTAGTDVGIVGTEDKVTVG